MSFERRTMVELVEVGKRYDTYQKPSDRLKQLIAPFTGSTRRYAREYWAIRSLSLEIHQGEVLGIIGVNGAGKSTLLQLITGVMAPSLGQIKVTGRVAALLELGAGFNPEFTGRENVYLNASLLGLTKAEINQRYDEIVSFAGLGAAIDQPVKTYSSGMYVRLGFSIATSVDPDVLIIDEALSVGDGAFAHKSFDRIVGMKNRGATVIFCSHSLFQVEAFCSRVLWLHEGRAMMIGEPAKVVCAYQEHLDLQLSKSSGQSQPYQSHPVGFDVSSNFETSGASMAFEPGEGANTSIESLDQTGASIESILSWINNDPPARHLALRSGIDSLHVRVSVRSNPHQPAPNLAFTLHANDGRTITSGANWLHALAFDRDANGRAEVAFEIPHFPLLKGHYQLSIYLLCQRGIHLIEAALSVCSLDVSQQTLEQGIVRVDQVWQNKTPLKPVERTLG